MKFCRICNIEKPLIKFATRKSAKDGRRNECKLCTNKKHKMYRDTPEQKKKKKERRKKTYCVEYYRIYRKNNIQKIRKSANKWAKNNKEYRSHMQKKREVLKRQSSIYGYEDEIKNIYINRPPGHHVDHIIPLNHKDVCRLHVPWNLQYLPAIENLKKSNKLCQ